MSRSMISTQSSTFPADPTLFENCTFVLGGHLPEISLSEIKLTLTALGASVADSIPAAKEQSVYAICLTQEDPVYVEHKTSHPHVTFVTPHWIDTCIVNAEVVPANSFYFHPFPPRVPAFEKAVISLTGYQGEARRLVKDAIIASGATFTNEMSKDNTHLINSNAPGPISQKRKIARTWGLKIVVADWLQDSLTAGRMLPWEPYDIDVVAEKGIPTAVAASTPPPSRSHSVCSMGTSSGDRGASAAAPMNTVVEANGGQATEGKQASKKKPAPKNSKGKAPPKCKNTSPSAAAAPPTSPVDAPDRATDDEPTSTPPAKKRATKGSPAAAPAPAAADGVPATVKKTAGTAVAASKTKATRPAASRKSAPAAPRAPPKGASAARSGRGRKRSLLSDSTSSESSSSSSHDGASSPSSSRSSSTLSGSCASEAEAASQSQVFFAELCSQAQPTQTHSKRASAITGTDRMVIQFGGLGRCGDRRPEEMARILTKLGADVVDLDDILFHPQTIIMVLGDIGRTEKFLAPAAAKIPIVTPEWVFACKNAKKICVEDDFVAKYRVGKDVPIGPLPIANAPRVGPRKNVWLGAPSRWLAEPSRPFEGLVALLLGRPAPVAVRSTFIAGGGVIRPQPIPLRASKCRPRGLEDVAYVFTPKDFQPTKELQILLGFGIKWVYSDFVIDRVNEPRHVAITDAEYAPPIGPNQAAKS